MRRVAVAISVALFATVAVASPAYADPATDAGKNKPSMPGGGLSQVATGHGATVSGVVPATPPQNTGSVASGAATTQGTTVSQSAQGQHSDSNSATGSGVNDVASGLGRTISEIAHTLEGDAKQAAIKDAVTQHHDAVTEATHQHGSGAADSADSDADSSSGQDTGSGGSSETARGHGADVSALAHATDGAKGSVVSAFANMHGDIVSAAARLNSGFAADDDADQVFAILDPTDIQLTA